MQKTFFISNFIRCYNIMWRAIIAFFQKSNLLCSFCSHQSGDQGYDRSDIWIQAASAGEALLACTILNQMRPPTQIRVMITTSTKQGMEILTRKLKTDNNHLTPNIILFIKWFPFDYPGLLQKIVQKVAPKIMIMLETEIWPGLFHIIKQNNIYLMILNGRMSDRSFKYYKLTRYLWSSLSPDLILAVSSRDAERFGKIFHFSKVTTMPNIKFDAIQRYSDIADSSHIDKQIIHIPETVKVSIFASVRRQEEEIVAKMILLLLKRYPNQILALFPRHMHRIPVWENRLKKMKCSFVLRSRLDQKKRGSEKMEKSDLKAGDVVLWDRFGEMTEMFGMASTAFVGGSLKPLGGQNFIEGVAQGTPTVVGRYTEDFAWVGQQIFDLGIVDKRETWTQIAARMISHLEDSPDRKKLARQADIYFSKSRGGAKIASRAILEFLYRYGIAGGKRISV